MTKIETFKKKAADGFNKAKTVVVDNKEIIIGGIIVAGGIIVGIIKAVNSDDNRNNLINDISPDPNDESENDFESEADTDIIYYSKDDIFKDVASNSLDNEYDVSNYDIRENKIYATILSHRRRIPRPSEFSFDEDGDLTFYTVTYPGERTTYGIGNRISQKLKEAYQKFDDENEEIDS